jgi:hypothetical protein
LGKNVKGVDEVLHSTLQLTANGGGLC